MRSSGRTLPLSSLHIDEKAKTLTENRVKAAKAALATNLLPDAQGKEPLTIEQALAQFEELEADLNQGIHKGNACKIISGKSGKPLKPHECSLILRSPAFQDLQKLAKICRKIQSDLGESRTDNQDEKIQTIRDRINRALSLAGDKSNYDCVTNTRIPLTRFLAALSYQINTQAEGMSVFQGIATDAMAACKLTFNNDNDIGTAEISTQIETITSQLQADNWNTTLGWVLWALHNIEKAFLSFLDNHIPGAYKSYNSYRLNNSRAYIGDISVNDQKIRFNLGPSLGTHPDSLAQGQLLWEEINGQKQLYHTLESPEAKGEAARLAVMRDLAEDSNLTLIGTPLDGDIAKGKGKFKKITSVEDFHVKLAGEILDGENPRSKIPSSVKDYNGFATGSLTAEEVKQTIAASQEAFASLLPSETFDSLSSKENERLSRAMTLGFTGFLVLKTLMKFDADRDPEQVAGQVIATMGQACKQDVDRGPVVNAITIAFIQMAKNGKLTGLDAKQIMGIVLGRSLLVDKRLMVKSRLEGLLDLLELIGRNQTHFADKLAEFTQGKLGFTPSNA